jgi:hypothetical protein
MCEASSQKENAPDREVGAFVVVAVVTRGCEERQPCPCGV